MASAHGKPDGVFGRVDSAGRLVDADPMLADLQVSAGSALGAKLALPQLAAVARLVRKLGITVSRPAVVAASDHDLELWVRGEPDGDDVLLWVESSKRRPASGPRLETLLASEELNALPGSRDDWETDAQLNFTSLSGDFADLAGATVEDSTGQPLTRLLRLEEGEDGVMPLLTALAARSAFAGQVAVARSGGQRFVLSGEPVVADDGGFGGFRGRAIADRKPVPEAANESGGAVIIDPDLDRALRSPLDRIIAAAEGIVERSEGPLRSDYAEYAGDIAAAARHLLSVIHSMAEQAPKAHDIIALAELAEEAVGLVEPQAEEREISIVSGGAEMVGARGEARAIIQIIVNLLGNAVRHSPNGGTVTLELAMEEGMARVSVTDQGPGIAPADQERIFEKFERLANGEGGAGLGLAIARRLARSMGGDVTVQSAPGEGARFTLSLPPA